MLRYKDILIFIEDMKFFFKIHGKRSIYLTGGEPTIWSDKGKDITDVLRLISTELEIRPALDTNGFTLNSKKKCFTFLDEYFSHSNFGLKISISVDNFHKFNNYYFGIDALKYLIEYKKKHKTNSLYLEINWVITTESNSAIDMELLKSIGIDDVKLSIIPLLNIGLGKKLSQFVPRMKILTNNGKLSYEKKNIGVYKNYLSILLKQKNIEIFERVHRCSYSPIPIFCWNKKYYYCLPQFLYRNNSFIISEIGKLKNDIDEFVMRMPFLKYLHPFGIFNLIKNFNLNRLCDKILKKEHPLRFPGCSICGEIFLNKHIEDIIHSKFL